MARAAGVTGEVICFLDADSERFGAHFACGVIGPLLCEPEISFVKGFYRRPFRVGETTVPDGGGRVTELTARPLLNLFYPDLAAVRQPLAGEIAARRELLERLPFATGYGVDIGLLIDAYSRDGLDAIAQVDLDVRQNAHQALRDLGPMAYAVLRAVAVRLEREGRLRGPLPATFTPAGVDAPQPAQPSRSSVRRCGACAPPPDRTARPLTANALRAALTPAAVRSRYPNVPFSRSSSAASDSAASAANANAPPTDIARDAERSQLGDGSARRAPRARSRGGRPIRPPGGCRPGLVRPGANSTSAPASW